MSLLVVLNLNEININVDTKILVCSKVRRTHMDISIGRKRRVVGPFVGPSRIHMIGTCSSFRVNHAKNNPALWIEPAYLKINVFPLFVYWYDIQSI